MRKFLLPLLLFLVIASCSYLFFHYNLSVYLSDKEQALRFVQSFGPWSVPVFMVLQVVQVIIPPIPGDVTGFIGGYLYGSALGTAYSTIGLTLGSWLAFYLARIFGLPLVRKIARPETIQKYDHFMAHNGRAVSFAFFLVPGFPKDALCYIIGLSHMPTGVFLLISTLGRLFGTILLSVAGSSVRQQQGGMFFIAAGALVAAALLAWLYRGKLHGLLRKSRDGEESRDCGGE